MDPNKAKIDVDPDYARNNTALRNIIKKEDTENKISSDQVYTVIAEEFDKELTNRQSQLEEIEEKITKAQKLLHILRYVLITSYYNKNLEHNIKESEIESGTLGAQNRIHPAIKKLLGKNGNLNVFSNLGKRKAVLKICDKNEASTSQGSAAKKLKLEPKFTKTKMQGTETNDSCLKNRKKTQHRIIIGNISKYMPSSDNHNTTHKWMVYVRGDKDKADISNIVERVKFFLHPSYKPHDIVEICEPPFHLSRRGWGEFPLRVQIVFKCKLNKPVEVVHNLKLDKTCSRRQVLGNETLVDVFLHEDLPQTLYFEPSTSHDIKSEPLEGLTVNHDEGIFIKTDVEDQMDFLLSSNDFLDGSYTPLDLNLENESLGLDITEKFSGIDIFRKPLDVNLHRKNQFVKRTLGVAVKKESDLKLGLDHDYCQGDEINFVVNNAGVKTEPAIPSGSSTDYSFNVDHSYCIPSDGTKEDVAVKSEPAQETVRDSGQYEDNKLRFGLDESYSDINSNNKDQYTRKSHSLIQNKPIKVVLQTNNETILTNGHLVNVSVKNSTPKYSLLVTAVDVPSKLTIKKLDGIPKDKFRNMGEVLPYLFRRFPLWSYHAKDPSYKREFPHVASSKQEYESWNIGKRINAEWNRAKALKRILASESIPEVEKWTVKTYFMYSRSHMYSPPVGFSIFQKHSIEVSLLNSCFANTFSPGQRKRNFLTHHDEAVDIEAEQDRSTVAAFKSDVIDISDPNLKLQCSYIKDTALDSGIMLKSEEIIDGVTFNGAERMIFEAVKCLAEGLIRRAHHYAVCSGNYRPNVTEVTSTDVQLALSERSEFKSLQEFGKKRQIVNYFS